MQRPYVIVEAPSNLGLKAGGVERLARSLLDRGLADRIDATRVERVEPPDARYGRDPGTGILNATSIAEWTPRLAGAVARALDDRAFPLVLGGDCSILLGPMLALRRRGRYGLLFIDGHTDFYPPEADPNGEAASMDLALVTGRGPRLLTDLDGLGPLVRDEDVVAFAFRDAEEQAEHGQPLPPGLLALGLAEVRRRGAAEAARAAVAHLTRSGLDGFFVHLDADVLADEIMPAVDYRLPGGLAADELAATLAVALESPMSVGLEVTIYNPSLDADGSAGALLTRVLVEALTRRPA